MAALEQAIEAKIGTEGGQEDMLTQERHIELALRAAASLHMAAEPASWESPWALAWPASLAPPGYSVHCRWPVGAVFLAGHRLWSSKALPAAAHSR